MLPHSVFVREDGPERSFYFQLDWHQTGGDMFPALASEANGTHYSSNQHKNGIKMTYDWHDFIYASHPSEDRNDRILSRFEKQNTSPTHFNQMNKHQRQPCSYSSAEHLHTSILGLHPILLSTITSSHQDGQSLGWWSIGTEEVGFPREPGSIEDNPLSSWRRGKTLSWRVAVLCNGMPTIRLGIKGNRAAGASMTVRIQTEGANKQRERHRTWMRMYRGRDKTMEADLETETVFSLKGGRGIKTQVLKNGSDIWALCVLQQHYLYASLLIFSFFTAACFKSLKSFVEKKQNIWRKTLVANRGTVCFSFRENKWSSLDISHSYIAAGKPENIMALRH